MNRTTRIRKAPNRDPVSLAATIAPTTTQNEAIDSIKVVARDQNLDPSLLDAPTTLDTPTTLDAPTFKAHDTSYFDHPSPYSQALGKALT